MRVSLQIVQPRGPGAWEFPGRLLRRRQHRRTDVGLSRVALSDACGMTWIRMSGKRTRLAAMTHIRAHW